MIDPIARDFGKIGDAPSATTSIGADFERSR